MADITISHDEAVTLYNHLDLSIINEIHDVAEDYDNMGYLVNLIHIYDRCKKEADKDNG